MIDSRSADAAAFVAGTAPGTRIVVRYRLPADDGGGQTDALGYLRSVDAASCVVETKRGEVTIALADIALAKAVPPPPEPRRPRVDPG